MPKGGGVSEQTRAICATWKRRIARHDEPAEIIKDLSRQYQVQRPAIRRALRSGGALPPYQPKQPDGPGRPEGGGVPGYTAEREARSAAYQARLEEKQPKVQPDRYPTPEPCHRCGVRADVGCKHRPAEGDPPAAIANGHERRVDGRSRQSGQGRWSFHAPTRSEVEWVKEGLFGGADKA